MTFELLAVRFLFSALDSIYFPPGKAANILRGAFGTIFQRSACAPGCRDASTCEIRSSCAYARIFAATPVGAGPSGLADSPRPFVFRASHLDGRTIPRGEPFHFDLHLFLARDQAVLSHFVQAFSQLATEGLGPGRGRAELQSTALLNENHEIHDSPRPLVIPLIAGSEPVHRIVVRFLTPTELKVDQGIAASPDFPVLFARARDRIATLRSLYGGGPLDLDFRALGDLSQQVRMTRCDVTRLEAERRSSRTGQTHSLGGFVGEAEYEGNLNAFYPFLRAAEWTGVGRQTVWGKGEILCKPVLQNTRQC